MRSRQDEWGGRTASLARAIIVYKKGHRWPKTWQEIRDNTDTISEEGWTLIERHLVLLPEIEGQIDPPTNGAYSGMMLAVSPVRTKRVVGFWDVEHGRWAIVENHRGIIANFWYEEKDIRKHSNWAAIEAEILRQRGKEAGAEDPAVRPNGGSRKRGADGEFERESPQEVPGMVALYGLGGIGTMAVLGLLVLFLKRRRRGS